LGTFFRGILFQLFSTWQELSITAGILEYTDFVSADMLYPWALSFVAYYFNYFQNLLSNMCRNGGGLRGKPQPLPSSLKGKALVSVVNFKQNSLQYDFGPEPLVLDAIGVGKNSRCHRTLKF
jgi:hypothetical protein